MVFSTFKGVTRMNVVLIDDEQDALDYLEDLLLNYEDVQVVGKYLNPIIGINSILNENIDLVFLDINMPNFSGIDVATELKKNKPNIFIVFVTAYDTYAIDAFKVEASDYLMKPVLENQLDETLTRIRKYRGNEVVESRLKIKMLQQIQFILPDSEPIPIHFNMTKIQHLFIYFLHNRGRLVRKEHIIDMLWEDLEEKNAFSQLYNAIYIMRKELEIYENFIQISTFSDSYRLDLTNAIVDVDEFELSIPTLPSIDESSYVSHQHIIDIFSGNYLIDYDYLWVENERYRLQTLWVNVALDLLHWYYAKEKYDLATNLCMTISEIAPLTETAYFYLMKISDERGMDTTVHYHYSQLQEVLYREIQEKPSQKIIAWYENWQKNKNN